MPVRVAEYIREQGLYRLVDGAVPDAGPVSAEEPRPGLPSRRGAGASEARPRLTVPPGTVDEAALSLAHRIVESAADKKASNIVLLDVRGQTTMTDYFVICSGMSDRQLGAIAGGITESAKENGDAPISREGDAASHWLLIDFGGVIVHVMSVPEREYYQLEKLWSEAPLLLHIL
jgi:ribosome-associated protein